MSADKNLVLSAFIVDHRRPGILLEAVTEMAAGFGGWGQGMSGPLETGVREQDGGLAGVYL